MSNKRKVFEGREVVGTEVAVSRVTVESDARDPYHVGDVVYLVCEVVIDKVTHRTVKDVDKVTRVEQARPIVGALVERSVVAEAIDLAKMQMEALEGIQRLDFNGDGE